MSYIGVQPGVGQYRKLDDISGSFNGSTTSFTTSVGGENVTAANPQQLLVSVGGVIQQPVTDYTTSTNSIIFSTAPASGLDFFAVLMGDAVSIGTPSDNTVTSAKLAQDLTIDLASGTVSAPSLTFDSNTGLYSPGADQVAIVTNGTAAVNVDSSQKVGFGVASPATSIDLNGNYGTNIVAVGALDIDCSAGNYFTKTINANSTFTVSNVPASRAFSFTLELTHTSGTITWFSGVEWPGGSAPTLTTGKTHLFMFVTDDGGTRWRASSLVDYTT